MKTVFHLLLSVLLCTTGCTSGTVTDFGAGPAPRDTTASTPTVARASVSAAVDFDSMDRAIAIQAGVALSSVQVRLASLSRPGTNLTARMERASPRSVDAARLQPVGNRTAWSIGLGWQR